MVNIDGLKAPAEPLKTLLDFGTDALVVTISELVPEKLVLVKADDVFRNPPLAETPLLCPLDDSIKLPRSPELGALIGAPTLLLLKLPEILPYPLRFPGPPEEEGIPDGPALRS